jgi:hypothetical protein
MWKRKKQSFAQGFQRILERLDFSIAGIALRPNTLAALLRSSMRDQLIGLYC